MTKDKNSLPEFPEGWELFTLSDIIANTKNSVKRGPFGSSIKKEFFVPTGYKVYEQKNVIYNNFNLGNYYIDENKFNELKDFELKSGDIVISCSGTIGIAIAPENLEKGIINQALLKIRLDNTKVISKYFVFLFKSKLQEIIMRDTRGSAIKNISSVQALKRMLFSIPPLPEQQKIVKVLSTIQQAIDLEEKRKTTLQELFKTMLNQLMTGQIRLKDVEV